MIQPGNGNGQECVYEAAERANAALGLGMDSPVAQEKGEDYANSPEGKMGAYNSERRNA